MKVESSRWRHRLPLKTILAVTLALFPGELFCQVIQQFPRQDFETRTNIDAAHAVSRNTDFLLGGGLHYSQDQGHIVYRKFSTGLAFHWHKFLTAEPYYLFSQNDEPGAVYQYENRLAFATIVRAPLRLGKSATATSAKGALFFTNRSGVTATNWSSGTRSVLSTAS